MFLKLMGAMPGCIYAQDKSGIYVNLFVGSKARVQFHGGEVLLSQATAYPWHGDVKVVVEKCKTGEFDLNLRIPEWCEGSTSPEDLYQPVNRPTKGAARLSVNGKAIEPLEITRGYAKIHRRWKSGDVIRLTLDMPVQRVKGHPQLEAAKGRVALMRGPVVYCFEGADNGGAVQNLVIPSETVFAAKYLPDLLGGVTVLTGSANALFQTSANKTVYLPFEVMATPYYANANRGTCPMQVWMPESRESATVQKQE